MLTKIKNSFSFYKNNNRGITLIELVVTIAVLAIVSTVAIVSYTSTLENQRMKADMSALNNIDTSLQQILMYDDAFDSVKNLVYDNNKLSFTFNVSRRPDSSDSYIDIGAAAVNGEAFTLKNSCEILYNYLIEYVGSEIDLGSASYQQGYYRVDIEFNGAQVSEIRDYVITNDVIKIQNSGDSGLRSYS